MNATRLFALLCLLTLAIGVTLPFVMPWGKPLAILASLTLVTLITELVLYRIIVRPHREAEIGMDQLLEKDYSTRLAPVG
ncbi:MAG: PAS domain-containing sensor histidine kinase, partial [Duncaniella sp.]|nr:PAS domain-containing sensor histidine kinase [Duncaniella sp.]